MAFHDAFLSSIRWGGRLNESPWCVNYKLKSGDLLLRRRDRAGMFAKGRLPIFAPKTGDVAQVRKLFEKTR